MKRPRWLTKKRADYSKPLTIFACVGAVLLAIWPVFLYGREGVVYDPSLVIYTITFMGIAAYTFYQRQTLRAQESGLEYSKEHNTRLREQAEADASAALSIRRANLSTALLTELKPIVARLQEIVRYGADSYHNPIPHPVLNEALLTTEVFDCTTVQRLTAVAFRLGDVERLMESFRRLRAKEREQFSEVRRLTLLTTNPNELDHAQKEARNSSLELENLRLHIRGNARWTHDRILPLVESLRLAGGIDPPPDIERVLSPEDLEVELQSPFKS